MFKSLKIKNFRGFRDIEFSELNRLNLITGKNNVGKTSFLEAIILLCAHALPETFSILQGYRGLTGKFVDTYGWSLLFNNDNSDESIRIEGICDDLDFVVNFRRDSNFLPEREYFENAQKEFAEKFIEFTKHAYALNFDCRCGDYWEEGYFFLNGQGEIARKITTSNSDNRGVKLPGLMYINQHLTMNAEPLNWLGAIQKSNKTQELIDMAKVIEPELTDILPVVTNGIALVHGRVNGKLLPLKVMGSGLNQFLFIMMAVIVNPGMIILIDELENGFHYSIYPTLWKLLAILSEKYGNQFFVTTHSYECLQGANIGVKQAGAGDILSYYRLDKLNDENHAYRLDYEEFGFALQHEMEIR